MCRELQIFAFVYVYVFGYKSSPLRLCGSDFGITPVDDITISVSAILSLLFMVPISPVPALSLLYFYVSTFRSICAVPNML